MQLVASRYSCCLYHSTMVWGPAGERGPVQPVCALHVLERLLHVMTYTPFIDLLVALLCPSPADILDSSSKPTVHDRTASGSLASTSQPSSMMPHTADYSPSRTSGNDRTGRNLSSLRRNVNDPGQTSTSSSPDRARSPKQGQTGKGSPLQPSAFQALFALHEHSAAYRECFMAALGGEDSQLACAAVRTLVAVLQSKAVSSEVLAAAGK